MSNAFEVFADQYAVYGYPVLFVGVLLENAAIPVPGETAVLMAGFLASPAGGGRFKLWLVIGLTALAAMLGDNLGFWLGDRLARPRLRSGRRFLFLTPAALQLAEGYFQRYGLWTVFLARFITGLRVIGALAAGTAGMPWHRFFLANAAGAIAWAVVVSLLGYFFGNSLELLHHWLGRGGVVLAAGVVLLVGLPVLWRHVRHAAPDLFARLPVARIRQAVLLVVLEVAWLVLLVLLAQGSHPTRLDREVHRWLMEHSSPMVDALANAGMFVGSLPVTLVAAAVVACQGWVQRRPRRELAAMLGALIVSELVGLLVVAALRREHVAPVAAASWPFGFAGLIPLRAMTVYGMAAFLLRQHNPAWSGLVGITASVLILVAGLSVVSAREQMASEVLLEYAAGGLVVVAGVWWLQEGGADMHASPSPQR
jgi:membrane-associated protein